MSTVTLAPTILRIPSLRREVVLAVTGVALIAASAQLVIPLPFTPVPITGQTFAFMLVGGAYGASRAASTAVAYLAVGALGVPVFAGATGGTAVLTSPTAGYLVGMLLAAVLVGAAADMRWDRRIATSLPSMLAASVLIYLVGGAWLALSLDVGPARAFELGVGPFLVGDLVKAFAASLLLPAAWSGVHRLLGTRP